jgi:hypothetical protein
MGDITSVTENLPAKFLHMSTAHRHKRLRIQRLCRSPLVDMSTAHRHKRLRIQRLCRSPLEPKHLGTLRLFTTLSVGTVPQAI